MNDFKSNNKGEGKAGSEKQPDVQNMTAELAKAMRGKSEQEIWNAILAQAEQGKKDGTLTNADLDNFYNALAPFVDGFKKQRLKSVIARLKQIDPS